MTHYEVCNKIIDIFSVYIPDYIEPAKIGQVAENVIHGVPGEINKNAKVIAQCELALFTTDETIIPGDITLGYAIENDLLDFTNFTSKLIPQHTDGTNFNREVFIFNAVSDALAMAMLKRCTDKSGNTIDVTAKAKKDYRFGIVRETSELAARMQASHPGCKFTGLEEYLGEIFPGSVWIHDKAFGHGHRIRPDYRCESLKLIVELDGTPHYKDPGVMERDLKNQSIYEDWGYKVVRIPYFVQLTREVVLELFGVDTCIDLCDPETPSMGAEWENTPAYCCTAGVARMATEFDRFPQQFAVNLMHLISEDKNNRTGASILQWFMCPGNRYIGAVI